MAKKRNRLAAIREQERIKAEGSYGAGPSIFNEERVAELGLKIYRRKEKNFLSFVPPDCCCFFPKWRRQPGRGLAEPTAPDARRRSACRWLFAA